MSMSSMIRDKKGDLELDDVELALQGNLCRCTGYRPIIEGFRTLCKDSDVTNKPSDNPDEEVATFDPKTFKPYTRSCDPEFPEELAKSRTYQEGSVSFTPKVGLHWLRPANLLELKRAIKGYKKVEFYAGGSGKFKVPWTNPEAVVQITHLQELRSISVEDDGVIFGSAVTMKELHEKCSELAKSTSIKEKEAFKTLANLLKTWVNPQVKNVASIGGHIQWAHPCSDIIPIFMVLGCSVNVLNASGLQQKIHIDEKFFPEAFKTVIKPGELIVSLKIPFTKPGEVLLHYRRARRKEFDLPIATAAFLGTADKEGKVQEVKIVTGGMEGAFPGARASPATFAKKTMEYLTGNDLSSINKSALADKVLEDIFIEEKAPGQFSNYRRCLVAVFAERFLADIANGPEVALTQRRGLIKSHQLFQKAKPTHPEDQVQRPVVHNWGAEQATGEASYVDDIERIEGELAIVPVCSEKPHAVIRSIDFTEALAVPGVVGYVTPKDVPYNVCGAFVLDDAVLSEEVVFAGQFIAALACENAKAGYKARKLVKVSYEEKPPILDMREIKGTNDEKHLFGGAPVKYERDQGVKPTGKTVTVKGTVAVGGLDHMYLEPHGALVIPSGEKDEYTIWAASQNLQGLQTEVAGALKIPHHKVIVKAKRLGGGFGGKERDQSALVAAVAAKKFGKPARLVFSRSDDLATTGTRHNVDIDYEATADETGRIVAINYNCNINGGAITAVTVFWTHCLLMRLDGGYTLKNYKGIARPLRTNAVPSVAFRGFGGPEGSAVVETVVSHIAHELGISENTVKEANLTKEGDKLHYGDTCVTGCSLQECWKEALKRSDFENKKKEIEAFNKENKVLKRGITATPVKFAVSLQMKMVHQGGAYVRIYTDGSVLLSHGGVEMGQGLHTKMLQVASRALGVDISKIHSHNTSTETVANSTVTAGSTGADLNGPAVIDACQQLAARLEPFKKAMPNATWEDWVMAAYASKVSLSAFGYHNSDPIDFDLENQKGVSFKYFTFGVGVSEVEVDCHTGDVTVLGAELVMDVGESLNPALDVGQIEGAYVIALGSCTMEQLLKSPSTGAFLTTTPSTYKIPTVADVPQRFNVTLLKHQSDRPTSACYSSKGIGEPPMMMAAGVPLAVRQAVASYRSDHGHNEWFHLDIPMTSDKIRMAAKDEYTEAAEKKSKHIPWNEKLAFQV